MNENPTSPAVASGKPTITELQAKELIFRAGVAAEQAAGAQGISHGDAATLLDAASGGTRIAGIVFPPIHAAFMLMLGRVEEFAKERANLGTDFGNMAALAFVLKNPALAWEMLQNDEAAKLFEDTVTTFAMKFTLADLKEISNWVAKEMHRFSEKGETTGK